jgi:hypothetical protein
MGPTGKLLLLELILAPSNEGSFATFQDLNMLAMTGGRERTEAEYRALLTKAHFALTAILPIQAGSSMIEAIPV